MHPVQHGYETAFIGKWHMGNDPTPRPGFDYWVALPGQGRTVNLILHEDGRLNEVTGCVADIFTDRAVAFVERPQRTLSTISRALAVHPAARQLDDGSVDLRYPRGYIPARLESRAAPALRESIRNPLLIRYPPHVPAGTRIPQLVLSVDNAPTLLELTGVAVGSHIQGRSFVPLLNGDVHNWREPMLVEFYT